MANGNTNTKSNTNTVMGHASNNMGCLS